VQIPQQGRNACLRQAAIDRKAISAEKKDQGDPNNSSVPEDLMERFLGGSPLAVIMRLIIISIVAGIALKAAGFDPRDLLDSIPRLIQAIYDLGFGWVRTVVEYFLLGAVIVIPVWLILRFVKFVVGDTDKGGAKPRS
jgi:L-cystine uptake protein TcyP (sodium:dicarboxylate symporter family)